MGVAERDDGWTNQGRVGADRQQPKPSWAGLVGWPVVWQGEALALFSLGPERRILAATGPRGF
jgi:hypothetical protein